MRTTVKITSRRRIGIGVATALIIGGCGGEATATRTPGAPSTPLRGLPALGEIAFTLGFGPTGEDGNLLCTVEPDGTGLSRLTAVTSAGNADPAWTVTGDRLLFDSASPSGASFPNWTSSNLFSIDLEGGFIRQLTSEPAHVYDENPSISPDGTRIAFDRFDLSGHRTGIFLMNADGSHIIRLTTPPASAAGGDLYPNFSPDGTKIAFVRDQIDNLEGAIYVVGVDGKGLRQVTSPTFLDATRPRWSPDGSKLLFATPDSDTTASGQNVYVVNSDGSGLIALTHDYYPDKAYNPAWSPDGTMIVFERFVLGSHVIVLVVMRADGSHQMVIWHATPNLNIYPQSPVWGMAP